MLGLMKTSSPPGLEELKKLARLLIFRQALANEQSIAKYDLYCRRPVSDFIPFRKIKDFGK
jgi:hypothetical protein